MSVAGVVVPSWHLGGSFAERVDEGLFVLARFLGVFLGGRVLDFAK